MDTAEILCKIQIVEMMINCPDCKALVPAVDGPTHPYFGSNAGCWKIYGEILEKEYGDPAFMQFHRLTVDAYAVQHPGKKDARSAQSVNVHLVALYLVLEKQKPFDFATQALGKLVEQRNHKFDWLTPPISLGEITVNDVVIAKSPNEHGERVLGWANSVWQAWHPYHGTIEKLSWKIF